MKREEMFNSLREEGINRTGFTAKDELEVTVRGRLKSIKWKCGAGTPKGVRWGGDGTQDRWCLTPSMLRECW
ncbi:hypothetical protein EYF80_021520 [Liparis tanakae]|uniref:Uncharacterized protein n=1 Tax=Liparis tanakae TaxID=230148 RepID=A0A4Z2HR28_9TELE|nr:hypothetical protein EYF80_021520 [Liparis tanakae]